ncbi:HAD-like domain-containing protein, partial [Russula compacta]
TTTLFADAALFNMDATLTDSIAAVEAARSNVAPEIGADPTFVIAATHGKRGIDDNLAMARFKPPHLSPPHELSVAVDDFERSTLFYAGAHEHGHAAHNSSTPSLLSDAGPGPSSSPSSTAGSSSVVSLLPSAAASTEQLSREPQPHPWRLADELETAEEEEDRAVRIFPGVKPLLESIPEGRYAMYTSGTKTYAHGCLARIGLVPAKVTITLDDPCLRAGKPALDQFLLAAAECLGYQASRCVVFEDSPSGIKAGVAAGAIVIAVCTSHSHKQVEECGAHFVVENLEDVRCE